jgi:flagellar hook assembly protein FlgD
VRSLVNEAKTVGNHKVVWDGKDDRGNTMASGIYLYRLETGKHSETRKMMLMK